MLESENSKLKKLVAKQVLPTTSTKLAAPLTSVPKLLRDLQFLLGLVKNKKKGASRLEKKIYGKALRRHVIFREAKHTLPFLSVYRKRSRLRALLKFSFSRGLRARSFYN